MRHRMPDVLIMFVVHVGLEDADSVMMKHSAQMFSVPLMSRSMSTVWCDIIKVWILCSETYMFSPPLLTEVE